MNNEEKVEGSRVPQTQHTALCLNSLTFPVPNCCISLSSFISAILTSPSPLESQKVLALLKHVLRNTRHKYHGESSCG